MQSIDLNFKIMKDLKKLTEAEMQSLNGGRIKVRIDLDEDGVDDVKAVWTDEGKLIKVKFLH